MEKFELVYVDLQKSVSVLSHEITERPETYAIQLFKSLNSQTDGLVCVLSCETKVNHFL